MSELKDWNTKEAFLILTNDYDHYNTLKAFYTGEDDILYDDEDAEEFLKELLNLALEIRCLNNYISFQWVDWNKLNKDIKNLFIDELLKD